MNLLQQLTELQHRHGWLSEETLRAFSAETRIPLYQLQAVTSFYPHYRTSPPPRRTVAICRDASCHIAGGCGYRDAIQSGLASEMDVEVHEVSCLGRCEVAPAACVDDVPLEGWSADDVVAAAKGAQPLPPDEPTERPRDWPTDPYPSADEHYGVLRCSLEGREPSRPRIPEVL